MLAEPVNIRKIKISLKVLNGPYWLKIHFKADKKNKADISH